MRNESEIAQKANFKSVYRIGIKIRAGRLILAASEIRHYRQKRIFLQRGMLFMRNRENEGFRANDAALLLFMVVAVWLWAFFR